MKSTAETGFEFIMTLLMLFAIHAAAAWTITIIWLLLVAEPFGLPQMPMAIAIALKLIASLLRLRSSNIDGENFKFLVKKFATYIIGVYPITLGIAWVFSKVVTP